MNVSDIVSRYCFRYDPMSRGCSCDIEQREDGSYVAAEDYDALAARLAEVENENAAMRSGLEAWQSMTRSAEARLDEAIQCCMLKDSRLLRQEALLARVQDNATKSAKAVRETSASRTMIAAQFDFIATMIRERATNSASEEHRPLCVHGRYVTDCPPCRARRTL